MLISLSRHVDCGVPRLWITFAFPETVRDFSTPLEMTKMNAFLAAALSENMLIETHAHLDYPDFAPDFDDVLRRADEAGVTRILTIGTSIASSQRAIDLAEKNSNIFAVIGVHPTYAEEAGDDVITPLRELAKSPRVVAIGETGLDYHSLPSIATAKDKKVQVFANALQGETEEQIDASIEDGAYKSKQAALFEQQLDLAVELRPQCRDPSARCLGGHPRNNAALH